jgi:phosphohistidine phosphatase SixA
MLKVFLVRHADIDLPRTSDEPSLNAAGLARARALARVEGTADVSAIFTSKAPRTKQTVAPLAARLRLQPREATHGLVPDLLAGPDGVVVLIAGHSDTVPDMIRQLGVAPPLPTIDEPDFDNP